MRFAILFLLATRLAHADAPRSDTTEAPPDTTNAPAARPPIEPWPIALPESPHPVASAAPWYSRFVATVGTGIGTANIGELSTYAAYYDYGEPGIVQTLYVDFGTRVTDDVMLGLHAGAASKTTFIDGFSDFMGTSETHYGVRTIQYGVTAQVAVPHGVWLAPWLGLQDSMRRAECYLHDEAAVYGRPSTRPCIAESDPSWSYQFDHQLAAGLTAGVDVYEQAGHRLSLVAAAVVSSVTPINGAPDARASYSSLSLSFAYRFWR